MSAYLKHAWAVFGLSLVASTAAAAIPDANGVIHGCYNALTGSTRIIDGNTCGLLEKNVNWSQTGPRGPAGPAGASVTGVSLPFGDANCPTGGVALTLSGNTSYICNANSADQIDIGSARLHFNGALAANSSIKLQFDTARAFTPSVPGAACAYNLTGTMFHAVPGVSFQPELATHQGTDRVYGLDYALVGFPVSEEQDITYMSTTASWDLEQDVDYKPYVLLRARNYPIQPGSPIDITITWVCKGGPNKTPN